MKAGSTSVTLPIFVQDTSSGTGAGLGSLVFNTASLAAKYRREGDSAWTTITLVTATLGTFTSGGFVTDGGPVTGGYEVGVPNAAVAAGAKWVELEYYGAANMLPVLVEIELDAIDYQTYPVHANDASGQAVATAANLANVQNNTFIATNIPQTLVRPASGSATVQIVVVIDDETGSPADIDSSANPTVSLVNNAGTNLSGRLGSWTHAATGKYTANYTSTSTDAVDDLHWEITGTVNSKARRYVAMTQIIDGVTGVVLAASQPNYAPAKAGDQMDLIDVPNATALAAVKAAVESGGGVIISAGLKKNLGFSHYFTMKKSNTPIPHLTITATLTIDSGSPGDASGTITDLGNGEYKIAFTNGDVNGRSVYAEFTAGAAADPYRVSFFMAP